MAHKEPIKQWDLSLVLSICTVIIMYILVALTTLDASNDHKCSHLPPVPEDTNYVWTSQDSYLDGETDLVMMDNENQIEFNKLHENHGTPKSQIQQRGSVSNNVVQLSKRHIDERPNKDVSMISNRAQFEPEPGFSLGSSIKDTLNYNFFSFYNNRNDLIPMKISVYYDESVHLLEEPKSKLIREHIIPTVIKFFERALSIRREFAIDTFRITRRCANVTYAKDNNNIARPFCLNKCDDHSICGEMIVPQAHLAGCSYCNTTTRKCYTNHSMEGKGVTDTQLLLYVSAKQTARCGREQTVAYAAHCAQDSKTDRPVAGHANLCPNSISAETKDINSLIATVKHELTHVLGFSVSLFAYYRDQDGKPLTDRRKLTQINQGQQQEGTNSQNNNNNHIGTNHLPKDPKTGYPIWSDKIVKKVIRRNWVSGRGQIDKEVHLLVTPTVVREVRAHFNCNTLEGAELEDQGHDGTSMTHWEKRLFENEAMTGTHTHRSVYSRLTLAALQDTGWYVANFSVAERLYWGKDLGCDFATQSCRYWMEKQKLSNSSIAPFCDKIKSDQLQITCTSDYTAKAVCNMRKYKQPLAEFYRNFQELDGVHSNDLGFYGGTVDLADYCPYVQEYTLQQHPVIQQGSRCSHVENNLLDSDKNVALEYFGSSSRCFQHGRHWTNYSCPFKRKFWPHLGAGCYKTSCNSILGSISLLIHDITYNCFYKGQELEVIQQVDHTLFNGTVLCPSCDMICPAKTCKQYNKLIIDDIINLISKLQYKNGNNNDNLNEYQHIKNNHLDRDDNPDDNGANNLLRQRYPKKRAVIGNSYDRDQDIPHLTSRSNILLQRQYLNDNSQQKYNHQQQQQQNQPQMTMLSADDQKNFQDAHLVQRWLTMLNKTAYYQTKMANNDIITDMEEHLRVFRLIFQQEISNNNNYQRQLNTANLNLSPNQMFCASSSHSLRLNHNQMMISLGFISFLITLVINNFNFHKDCESLR